MDEIISPSLWQEIKKQEVRGLLEFVVLLENRGTYHDKTVAIYEELAVTKVIKEHTPFLKRLDEMEPLVKGRRPYGKVLNTLGFWVGRHSGVGFYPVRRRKGNTIYSETPPESETLELGDDG